MEFEYFIIKMEFKHKLSYFHKQYLSSFFTPPRGAAGSYEPRAQEVTPGALHFSLAPHTELFHLWLSVCVIIHNADAPP